MPTLTRWFIKTSFLYLVAALLVGILQVSRTVLPLPPFAARLDPVYFHLFMVGWVTEMIFGVAYWMFPIINRDEPRGSSTLGWITYFLLNAGLLLRAASEPLAGGGPRFWGWLLVVSALLQWLAGLIFVVNTWQRVKGKPKRRRRTQKQKQA